MRVKTNSYSSPLAAGARLLVKAWPLHVDIYEDLTCVATHTRCCNGPRYLPVIVRASAPGIVALLSPYFIVSKRSSPSRVRFAAPIGAPLTAPSRFGASSYKGETAWCSQGANVTLTGAKIAVRYTLRTNLP